ncbi:hypothetical protein HMPREF1624_06999 [Sporothrix schenckii ATCC 58251]|uniref:3-phytase n=1 Tax=Sporothrix schenckii (strain ATCC 58251 / de Perez 2211183) TaxID=1391915 RepID=U7PQL2_SPOS1|nr:hypothetical protein HMPREF1624_06999 [Sporothrix schenckii ATCC 58251]
MTAPFSSIVDGVSSLFGGSGSRSSNRYFEYQPVTSPSSAADLFSDDDGSDGDSDGMGARRHRRSGGRRRREPMMFMEAGSYQNDGGLHSKRQYFDSDFKDGVFDSVWARGHRRFLKLTLLVVMAGLMLYLSTIVAHILAVSGSLRRGLPSCDTTDHGYQCYPKVAQYWGQYSPFFSAPSDISNTGAGKPTPPQRADSSPFASPQQQSHREDPSSAVLPPGCHFTFAQVLSRHGARDPTWSKTAAYAALISRIQKTTDAPFEDGPDGNFAFLNNFTYSLGADELTLFGEQQMVNSGVHFYQRYQSLLKSLATSTSHGNPFVRSADENRVVQSAKKWIKGFQSARHAESDSTQIVLLPEAAGFNNTLSHNGLCKRFSSHRGSAAQRAFAATFVPAITARLNRGLPQANLTDTETIYFMDLCPFETVADEEEETAEEHREAPPETVAGGRVLSPFCHLFTETEWHNYDYYQTLGKWYGYGDGSDLGPTQGVGFVNELVARLTASPVVDHTSTNRTMDADPATFPLDAKVYADFSHDNDMSNIFAALGLYNGTFPAGDGPSNTTRTEPEDMRGYASSWVVPFGARMYVEKMVCGGDKESSNDEFVRILVNDRVMPLQSCGADQLGRCRLSRFIDSLAFARNGGLWDDCFA